jgi:hypothetical protein
MRFGPYLTIGVLHGGETFFAAAPGPAGSGQSDSHNRAPGPATS